VAALHAAVTCKVLLPSGVTMTVGGLKEQITPTGRPAQDRETGPEKPFNE